MKDQRCTSVFGAAVIAAVLCVGSASAVDYVRDVRPLLSAKCFFCHGPDEATREAGLRLDQSEAATEDLGGYAAIVPGAPGESELMARVRETDPDMRMPPPDSGKTLSAEEIEVLRAWIEEGAEYQPHWAFETIRRPELPGGDAAESRHAVDQFVNRRLAEEGLDPAPSADAYTLVRRVYLDLIGLPPTPAEADAFAADPSDEAYGKIVDRLLASPRYGERWARLWLDLARYSDTKGYEKDQPRTMWPYRDWVIDAINADMPFDRFTVEQLAGDMLPEPTTDQLVATGFHRNTMTNEEGGIDPEEFRFLSVVDRVNTTGTTWLGLTIGCAQCHTHKYDPITHTDYYGLFALLNNADEPELQLPTDESRKLQADADAEIEAFVASLEGRYHERAASHDAAPLPAAVAGWAEELAPTTVRWDLQRPERVETNLPLTKTLDDGSVLVSGDVTNMDRYDVWLAPNSSGVTAIRLEAIPDASLPRAGSGRRTIGGKQALGAFLLTELEVAVVGPAGTRKIELHSASASHVLPGLEAGQAIDGRPDTGWTVEGRQRQRQTLVVRPVAPIELSDEERLRVTLKHESFYPAGIGRFRLATTDDEKPAEAHGLDAPTTEALLTQAEERTEEQLLLLRDAFLRTTPVLESELSELHRLIAARPEPVKALVMRERDEHGRVTHRRHRGEYLKTREVVSPATPATLPGLAAGVEADRLALARWLVDPGNPLTARVVVNRHWQALFGRGLVKTAEDFGLQGEYPSHPELLDWLAAEFMEGGWSRKRLHRLIVTSDAYKRSSVNAESAAEDPENVLLARGPRLRLEAEVLRDVVLEAAGLLSDKIGGPSVFPPQPPGVTEAAYGPLDWVISSGEDRYRRGLYTFNKRTAPYAAFGLFDAPSGEVCTARRDRSSTPLQALAMLNDEVIAEAARSLARDLVSEESDDPERASEALRRCLTRPATDDEIEALVGYVVQQRSRLAGGDLDPYRVLNVGPRFEWAFEGTDAGWSARNDAELEVSPAGLLIHSTGEDPFLGVDVDAPAGSYIVEVDADLETAGPIELFWTTADTPAESQEQSTRVKTERGKQRTYRLRFQATSPVRSLRLDVGHEVGDTILRGVRMSYGDGLLELGPDEDPVELATWKLAARAIMNLDEFITRP